MNNMNLWPHRYVWNFFSMNTIANSSFFIAEYLHSLGCNALAVNDIHLHSIVPSLCWYNTAPSPTFDALVATRNGQLKSGCDNVCADTNSCFNASNASFSHFPHLSDRFCM